MMPGADSDCMLNNIRKFEAILGREDFDSREVINNIRREAVAMGIAPSTHTIIKEQE